MLRAAVIVAAVLALSAAPARAEEPSSLDPGFGDGGRVQLGSPGDPLGLAALATTASGDLVGAGNAGTGALAARFLPGGLPDLAFGTDGLARLPSAPGVATHVAPVPDGRVLLAGDGWVARLSPDGSPDPAFGGDGDVANPNPAPRFPGSPVAPAALLARPDGSAVVLHADHTVRRIAPDGTVDPAFGGNVEPSRGGRAVALVERPGRGFAVVTDATVALEQADGIAIVTGLDAEGHVDRSFAGGQALAAGVAPRAAAVGPDGRIVVAGESFCGIPRGSCPSVVAFTRDGADLPGYVRDGEALDELAAFDDQGRLVTAVGGRTTAGGAVSRYTADGRPDPAFGACGDAAIPGAGPGALDGLAVLPGGRIVLAGRLDGGRLLLQALRGTGSHDPDGPPTLSVAPDGYTYPARAVRFAVRSPERATLRTELLLSPRAARRARVRRVQSVARGSLEPCRRTVVRLRLRPAVVRRLRLHSASALPVTLRSVVRNAAGVRRSRARVTLHR